MAYFQAVMIAAVVGLLAAPATAATALVSNTADAGAGSFRAAVEAANSDPAITSIRFRRDLGTIELQSTVTYAGAQALTIDGRGTEIGSAAAQTFDLFIVEGGGDLTLRSLTFREGDNGISIGIPPFGGRPGLDCHVRGDRRLTICALVSRSTKATRARGALRGKHQSRDRGEPICAKRPPRY